MSQKYTGGFITKSPVAPTTSAASGIWTLDQQQQAQKAGTWPSPPMFIEDLFSTYLYTGTGAAQTITNGIDLSTNGGLVWFRDRTNAYSNGVFDSARGITKLLVTNTTAANVTTTDTVTSFNTTGFSIGIDSGWGGANGNVSDNYVSWTFRKQPKFFDVVTYTGNATAGRTVAHNLGSVPGCIIIKKTTGVESWAVYHRSLGTAQALRLNLTNAASSPYWNGTSPTDTVFTVDNSGEVNDSGATYVAYLFAHDAGGFPVSGSGSTNGISCGTFTTVSSAATVDLGYEPQWILWKRTDSAQNWNVYDTMRGLAQTKVAQLYPNLTQAEDMYAATSSSFPSFPYLIPTATGFQLFSAFGLSGTYIYVAIRRGPMKTPTVGTSVFSPQTATYTANQVVTTGFVTDMVIQAGSSAVTGRYLADRLRGVDTNYNLSDPTSAALTVNTTDAESAGTGLTNLYTNTGYRVSGGFSGFPSVNWNFGRAPSFFDEVCYTGNDVLRTITHNLGVAPEMMIIKNRDSALDWAVYHAGIGNTKYIFLNSTAASVTASSYWNDTSPTASVFTINTTNKVNSAPSPYVAYLFATCAGVSKVGSYTGNGSTQTIACGFTAGSRFVLIKRTDSTGDWYVWDSARGIVAGNDPHLSLNDTAAQVTTDDSLDTDNTGFIVNQDAATNINVTSAAYIFLAIA